MKIGNIECYGIIYKIKNKINGKIYIGQTKSDRGFNSRYCANGQGIERVYNYYLNNKGSGKYNIHLIRSIEKYGIDSFEVDEIFDIAFSKQELDIKEKCWISIYKTLDSKYGYNKRDGGQDGSPTYESRKLNSISRLGFDISKYVDDIINMYVNEKQHIINISKKYGVNDCVIDRILKENNIKKRNESEVLCGYNIYDYKDKALELYNKGYTKSKICRELGITMKPLCKMFEELNIKPRTMKEVYELRDNKYGKDNPASVTTVLYDINMNEIKKFNTKKECGEYMVNNKISPTIRTALSAIDRSIQYNRPYKNKYYFKKIKNNI